MPRRTVENLFQCQTSSWELAKANYAALKQVRTKELNVNGIPYQVQFNPARMLSSAAKVDRLSIQQRKCFLCVENRPKEQEGIEFQTEYHLLVNPFPIFPKHFTIPLRHHEPQHIKRPYGFAALLDLATYLSGYVVLYNGPCCGASAPDHLHFQAGNRDFLPIVRHWEEQKGKLAITYRAAKLWQLNDVPRNALIIESNSCDDAIELFNSIYCCLKMEPGEEEPRMNLLAWQDSDSDSENPNAPTRWIVCITPRTQHRPTCYSAEGDANRLISPGAVDMGGVFITPQEKDFEKLTAEEVAAILREVCLPAEEVEQLLQRIKEKLT